MDVNQTMTTQSGGIEYSNRMRASRITGVFNKDPDAIETIESSRKKSSNDTKRKLIVLIVSSMHLPFQIMIL